MGKTIKRKLPRLIRYAAIFLVCAAAVGPYLWMILVSLKNKVQIYQPGQWIFTPTLDNYLSVIQERGLFDYMKNSAIVAVCNCLVSMVLGSMTAYALARYRFKRREACSFFMLFIRMLPAVASVIPLYVLASALNIYDTHFLLITVYLLFNIPFTVLMMRGFIEEIPYEIEEAALVDGCTTLQSLRKVVVPMALPGMIATAIFCIINCWNEFTFAMMLTTFRASTTPTIVQMFITVTGTAWGEMAAVGTIATFPVIVFAICVQKHMVRGISFGAVKG